MLSRADANVYNVLIEIGFQNLNLYIYTTQIYIYIFKNFKTLEYREY